MNYIRIVRTPWVLILLLGIPLCSANAQGQPSGFGQFVARLADQRKGSPAVDAVSGLRAAIESALLRARGLTSAERATIAQMPPAIVVEQANNPTLPASALQPYMATPPGQGGPTTGEPAVGLVLESIDAPDKFIPNCTGTLISPDEVVTAAHCFCPPAKYSNWADCFHAGSSSDLTDPQRTVVFFQQAGVRSVKEVDVDEAYTFPVKGPVLGDIALLKLDHPIPWITPARLPAEDQLTASSNTYIAGFGWTATRTASSFAQRVTTPGLKSSGQAALADCSALGGQASPADLCISFKAGSNSGMCGGDSGGPLWDASSLIQLGTATGGTMDPCVDQTDHTPTTQVEMRLQFPQQQQWLQEKLDVKGANQQALWPAFGSNLIGRLTKSNQSIFEQSGRFTGGWVTPGVGTLLVTANSTLPIKAFKVETRGGRVVCSGMMNSAMDNYVNWCMVAVRSRTEKYRLTAQGVDVLPNGFESQPLQYFLAVLPADVGRQ